MWIWFKKQADNKYSIFAWLFSHLKRQMIHQLDERNDFSNCEQIPMRNKDIHRIIRTISVHIQLISTIKHIWATINYIKSIINALLYSTGF